MNPRGWWIALVAALVLALVSLASNITSDAQLSGEADSLLAVRFTVSKLANAGAVWGGLGVLSGWLVRRPGQAVAAGITACLLALGAHYGLGAFFGVFEADVWTENAYWFAAAVLLGGPLGLVGAIGRRPDLWGVAARLLVPVAAMVEPFVIGMFANPAVLPWPDRVSSAVSGIVLLAVGAVSAVFVVASAVPTSSRPRNQAATRIGAPAQPDDDGVH